MNRRNDMKKEEKNESEKKLTSIDKEEEINPIKIPFSFKKIKNIFGESLEEKQKKLKNKSLFGNFNT